MTDSAPVDKINFVKAYNTAHTKGMTSQTIKSAWKTTGNWPISRQKALSHPEIQIDKEKRHAPEDNAGKANSDEEIPKSGRDIMNLAGPNASTGNRRKFRRISRAFNSKEAELAIAKQQIRELKAQVERLTTKKRKAVPNPNRKFMQIEEILGKEIRAKNTLNQEIKAQEAVVDEDDEVDVGEESEDDDEEDAPPPEVRTRSGRASKIPSRYID